jgi:transcriptional regulator with XRE-family HTH domain
MNLGSRLKDILADRGLTVTQFSKMSEIPAQTLYALINRDSNKADVNILLKLLSTLDMDLAAFMGAEPVTPGNEQAQPIAGKTAVSIDEKLYDQILEQAAEEGVTDPAAITRILNDYLLDGLGYRQRSLRSLFRDAKPHDGQKHGDMDSFLL